MPVVPLQMHVTVGSLIVMTGNRTIHALMLAVSGASAAPAMAENLSYYGTPGLIEMPSGYGLNDGNLAFTAAYFGTTLRSTLTFQIMPRVQGSFRYARIEGFDDEGDRDRFDRSFDLHFSLIDESEYIPAVSVGLRDFAGTGIYSSEYIAGSKQITDQLNVTAGVGWGRLAGRNSFASPLGFIDQRFEKRPNVGAGGIDRTGQLDFGAWFRGDASVFGGVSWDINDQWTVMAEYSPDLYPRETRNGVIDIASPLNFGTSYRFDNGVDLGAYYLYGTDVGLRLSYIIDPRSPSVPGGSDLGPRPIMPRSSVAGTWEIDPLAAALGEEGLELQGIQTGGGVAWVRVQNGRHWTQAQAIGRAARTLANTLPPDVEAFDVTLMKTGLPLSTTRVQRSDLEELEFALDGSWQSFARAEITNPVAAEQPAPLPGLYPAFSYDIGPYFVPAFFDPDSPIRIEYGAQLDVSYSPQPGLIFSGRIRHELGGNLSDARRRSDSRLPRVRSQSFLYAAESTTELTHLTAEYFFRPGEDLFGRVTAGYLEQMFGGVSAEVLWHPIDSRLAFGVDVNYVRQRDYDTGFGFQDYKVATGHATAYYDFGNGFNGQLYAGRYLAGDWGATLALDREFNNGFRVGAFATLTDVPFERFGEGSFDKGIWLSVPTTWLTGKPSRGNVATTLRPVLRDGGARLAVRNPLYGLTRDTRATDQLDGWGRFWR